MSEYKYHKGKALPEQLQIVNIINRCAELDKTFLGFVGEYTNDSTRLKLRCNKDGHEWETTTIQRLLSTNGKGGCKVCQVRQSSERERVPDDVAIEKFLSTSRFTRGTEFIRTENKIGNHYIWQVICPVCSNDEYVQAGVCSGIFESTMPHLKRGSRPCRCSFNYKWTEAQVKYRVEKMLLSNNLPYVFEGWVGSYTGTKGMMSIFCEAHGRQSISIGNFLNNMTACPLCATHGFMPHKPASVYILKITDGISDSFTGYGISGNYKKRRRVHKKNLTRKGLAISDEFVFNFEVGENALHIENLLKNKYDAVPQDIEGFKTEATHGHLYNEVVDFVREHANIAWTNSATLSEPQPLNAL